MILAWGNAVSAEFRAKVLDICARLLIPDPSWLMACMRFESNLSPTARNALSGATGLIQFTLGTAGRLGTTLPAIAAMSALEQLDLVYKYLLPYMGRLNTLEDTYMAILWPAAVGKPVDYVLFGVKDVNAKAYIQNKGLDLNADGLITKAEATVRVGTLYEEGVQPPNGYTTNEIVVPRAPAPAPAPALPTPLPQPAQDGPMPIALVLGLIQTFGPAIMALIPQVGTLFGGAKDAKVAGVIGTVLDTIVKTTGQTGPTGLGTLGAAVEAMQADPAMAAKVQNAIVTHPDVLPYLQIVEIGTGGIAAARDADVKATQAEKSFWYAPSFWVVIFVFMPPFDFLVFRLGSQMGPPSENLVTQVVTTILSLLAIIAAFYFGSTTSSQRKTELAAQAQQPVPTS